MNRYGLFLGGRISLLVLLVAWGGLGCAHFRKPPAEQPVATPIVEELPVPDSEPPPSPSQSPDEDEQLYEQETDPDKVLVLQDEELEEQDQCKDEGVFQRLTGFTRWLDNTHELWFRRMDNAVRRVDTMWLTGDTQPYEHELSTVKLRTIARVGGRGSEKDMELKVRVRVDLALPGLERKLHLFVGNDDRDALPGSDPLKQKDDFQVGAQVLVPIRKGRKLSLGGGVRWRDSHPVEYADLEWNWKWDVSGGTLWLDPRVAYYTDDGLGQKVALTWKKELPGSRFFQMQTAERSSEGLTGMEFEQTFRLAWLRSGLKRGWVVQASVFPRLASSDWTWQNSLVNVTWRDGLYRKWIYYTITPQIEFPKEDKYEAQPSLRVGLEILFGGKISDLL